MIRVELPADDTDDPEFSGLVAQIITGAVVTHRPPRACIFKIDHWFDHKWLAFSGKVVGAAGSWRKQLTVPPFVANRIVEQLFYNWDAAQDGYH